MFSKSIVAGLLAFALSVQAVPARQQNNNANNAQCGTLSTVIKTVTVTARGATATVNQANNNGSKTAATTKAANNNAGTKTTSTKAAAQTTAAATTGNTGNAGNTGNTGNAGNTGNTGNPQTSLTLDPRVIASGFANNGQGVPTAGQVASLTSTNNFINFCLTVPNLPITNGKQITTGSCNPAPIGVIPSTDNMPSSKFTFPANFGTIKANTAFTISMAIQNMQTGFFVNAQQNYFAAPQQLNSAGQIQGHSHVVVEALTALDQTTPTDPKKFVFFKGLNAAASGGVLTADVTAGLPVGVYKLSSINTAANHQPVIVPVAQHGSLDDAIYFSVTADGKAAASANTGAQNAATTAAAATATAKAATAAAATATAKAATGAGATAAASAVKGAATAKAATTVASAVKGAATAKAATTVASSKAASSAASTAKGSVNISKNGSRIVSSAAASKSSAAATNGRIRRMVNRLA